MVAVVTWAVTSPTTAGCSVVVAVVVVRHRPLHGRGTKWLFLRFERV